MDVRGKRILVTGGSSGIGAALTQILVARGASVIIVARDGARAQDFATTLGGDVAVLPADLSDPDEQDRVIGTVHQRWPDLAMLVNNAGIQVNLPPTGIDIDYDFAALRTEIATNLTAVMALSYGLLPLLSQRPEAMIVNVGSGLGVVPKRSAPLYCATKAAVHNFSTALRYRCQDSAPHVRITDVVMDYVETNMTAGRQGKKMAADTTAAQMMKGIAHNAQTIWIGRTKALRVINRISPAIARRILRNG